VSPENVDICMLLTEEFRHLPKHHRAREDKLEVILIFLSLDVKFKLRKLKRRTYIIVDNLA